jgi:hypothetical protein
MAFEAYIRLSPTSGNPEIWAFDDNGVQCNLMYGSLVTGGITTAFKPSAYGQKKKAEKLKSGYTAVSFANPTASDIQDAKQCFKGSGSPAPTSLDCAKIVQVACQVAGMPVFPTVRTALSSNAAAGVPASGTSSPAPAAATAKPKKPTTPEVPAIVSLPDDVSAPWAW